MGDSSLTTSPTASFAHTTMNVPVCSLIIYDIIDFIINTWSGDKMQKLKNILRANLRWIVLFISIVSLLFLIEDVMDKDIMAFDEKGYSIVSNYLISDNMTLVAKCITFLGSAYWLIGLSAFLFAIIKDKNIPISVTINLALSALLNITLKHILQRPRPVGHNIIDESGYSLPSGHSMVSMAFYGFIIYLIFKNVKNKCLRVVFITLLSILIFSIGISRIYLGVHYASDVIVGFLVAISYLTIYSNFMKKYLNIK